MTTQTNSPYAPNMGANGGDSDPQAKAQEAAGQAQEKAQAVAGQMQDRVREQLSQRSSQVAEQINSQAADLRSVSETLREQGKDAPAKAADRLAEYAEKVGGYLSEKDPDALLHDAEDFGRRQPAAFAAGGMLLGFAASRFLKASSRRRSSSASTGQASAPAQSAPVQSAGSPTTAPPVAPVGAVPSDRGTVPPAGVFTPPGGAVTPPLPGGVPPVDRGF